MSANDVIPTADEILGAGVASLIAARPTTAPYVNYGGNFAYAKVFAGWRAQIVVLLRRLADEAKSKRLALAEGSALIDLVVSEFAPPVTLNAAPAVGEIILVRPLIANIPGVIRKGQRFRRAGNPDAQPLKIEDMVYEVTRDVVMRGHVAGNLLDTGWPSLGAPLIRIPVVAQRAGKAGNQTKNTAVPNYNTLTPNVDALTITAADPLFDPLIVISDFFAAGGTDAIQSDAIIRKIAQALVAGREAPTGPAIVAGAYSTPGVTRVTTIDNPRTGRTVVFASDDSWAYSGALATAAVQTIKNDWSGFGCSVQPGQIQNYFIHVLATVCLTDSRWLTDTSEIDKAIQAAVLSYFNDRPDWYTWSLKTLQAVISRAHRKVQKCTTVAVKDAATALDVTPPGALVLTDAVSPYPILTHYYVPDSGTISTYLAPT